MADKKAKIPIDFFFKEEVENPTPEEIEAEKEFEPPLEEGETPEEPKAEENKEAEGEEGEEKPPKEL